jgi:hypothetical protein
MAESCPNIPNISKISSCQDTITVGSHFSLMCLYFQRFVRKQYLDMFGSVKHVKLHLEKFEEGLK